jgi:hypothetical protein
MKLKAYKITDDEGLGVICFATSASKAKSLSLGYENLDCEYIELHCNREPKADIYATGEGVFDFASHPNEYRLLGWFTEGSHNQCDSCGLYEYPDLPESTIETNKETFESICKECKDKSSAIVAQSLNSVQHSYEAINLK